MTKSALYLLVAVVAGCHPGASAGPRPGATTARASEGAGGEPGRAGPAHPAPAADAARAPARPRPTPREGYHSLLAARDLEGNVIGPPADDKQATAIVFFASWCGPCRRELAMLGELAAEEPRLRIIGVNAFEEYADRSDEARLRAFLAESAPWLQVVRADDALLYALGKPSMVPTVYVFDRGGDLVRAYLRARRAPPGKRELADVIAEAIARSAAPRSSR